MFASHAIDPTRSSKSSSLARRTRLGLIAIGLVGLSMVLFGMTRSSTTTTTSASLVIAPAYSTAYGTLNNFDCVNDTGVEAHGFEIELDDIRCSDISYTYDYNHYGIPEIREDHSDPAHPKVFVKYAAKKNPDGSWSAYTAVPSGPINPTDGHQFTDPSINFGGEHFGVGFNANPSAVKYNWLIDDGSGNLVHGPPVYIATPNFAYFPPAGGAPANVVAAIAPPPPPVPPVLRFGEPVWVKSIKTTTHNANKVRLQDLVADDPGFPDPWANGEPDEVEVEWKLLQTEFGAADGGVNGELEGGPEDLPDGDEVITRRYEFFKYLGPIDGESGEAMASEVAEDGLHGVGIVTYNSHIDPNTGEWVEVEVDLSTIIVVGEFFGAQMSGFDVVPVLGMIDNLQDCEVNVAYPERRVVIAGGFPFVAGVRDGTLPPGMTLDAFSGILTGVPEEVGAYTFTVEAVDFAGVYVSHTYTLTITSAAVPGTYNITTTSVPAVGGTTTGGGTFVAGDLVTVLAVPNAGYYFDNWSEADVHFSFTPSYSFNVSASRDLVANFLADPVEPVLDVTVNPSIIKPKHLKMVLVRISGTVNDPLSGVDVDTGAFSTVDSYGKLQPSGTYEISPTGTFSFTLLLDTTLIKKTTVDRVYTITLTAKDMAKNQGSKAVTVTVPHK